jgi:hypothetical protein
MLAMFARGGGEPVCRVPKDCAGVVVDHHSMSRNAVRFPHKRAPKAVSERGLQRYRGRKFGRRRREGGRRKKEVSRRWEVVRSFEN